MRLRHAALTLWLIAPIAVVVLLSFWIVASQRAGPKMHAEPVGAGAGDTGGANALGEYLRQRRESKPVTIAVDVRCELPAGATLLIAHRANGWNGQAMIDTGTTRWTAEVLGSDLDEGFEVLISEGDQVLRDAAGRRRATVSAGEQVVILRSTTP
jgi:hypothetical protein